MAKKTYSYGKRDLFIERWYGFEIAATCMHLSDIPCGIRIHMANETYSSGKRDLFMAKQTYSYGKIDLFLRQKRPVHMVTKICSYGKRVYLARTPF